MSVTPTQIRCHGCNFAGALHHAPITLMYVLPDGQSAKAHRGHGWCAHCDGLRDIEQSIDRAAIQEKLARLEPKAGIIGYFSHLFRPRSKRDEDELIRLRVLLRVAELRRSTLRCLSCGNDAAIPLQFDGSGVANNYIHSCGGRLYRLPRRDDGMRISLRPEMIYLDADGRRMPGMPDAFDE